MDGPGRLSTTRRAVLEDTRNRLGGASETTVLEVPERLLATGATMLEGPMMPLPTGATVFEWPWDYFLFLSIIESQMKLLMHFAICDFVNK